MLRVVIVDATAESRNALVRQIDSYVNADISEIGFVPRVSIKPLSIEELKFNETPDICILGHEIFERDHSIISRVKKLLPKAILFMKLPSGADTLTKIEMLASLGIDEIFTDATPAYEFLKKLILLSRKREEKRSGTLLLIDGAKGGVGTTSVAAGLAEILWDSGKRVALLDFDSETQDLSRFLQVRPFVNENLQLLLSGSRPVSEEMVMQALTKMWQDDDSFYVMPPVPETEELYSSRSPYSRNLLSVLEVLDEIFDLVVVDIGSAKGAMLQTLYRAADRIVYVINNDPASLYSSAARLNRLRSMISPAAKVLVVENCSQRLGLDSDLLEEEFHLAVKLEKEEWSGERIPFSKVAMRWPGSGDTIASAGGASLLEPLTRVLRMSGLLAQVENSITRVSPAFPTLSQIVARLKSRTKSKNEVSIGTLMPAVALPDAAEAIMIPPIEGQSKKLLHFNPLTKTDPATELQTIPSAQSEEEFFVKAKVG